MDAATINGKQIRRKVQLYKEPQAGIREDSPAGAGLKKQEEL